MNSQSHQPEKQPRPVNIQSLTVAIGSKNRSKIEAVRKAVTPFWPKARFVALAVDSGVSEMPTSRAEGKRGALQRAQEARTRIDADLGVGLEGAIYKDEDGLYITNWVAIVDAQGDTGVANSGSLPLPESLAERIHQGEEIGLIIDLLVGRDDASRELGAAGFFTRGLIPRSDASQLGVAFALAPFLHASLYWPDREDTHKNS